MSTTNSSQSMTILWIVLCAIYACTSQQTIITDAYGGSGGVWKDLLNQGRVYSIQDWGYHPTIAERNGLHIRDWYADDQTENFVYDTALIESDDFITGYEVYGFIMEINVQVQTYACGYPDFTNSNDYNYAQIQMRLIKCDIILHRRHSNNWMQIGWYNTYLHTHDGI
eukprot:894947_1